jgi:hypothetical protein
MDRNEGFPHRLALTALLCAALVGLAASHARAAGPPKGRFVVGDSIALSATDELLDLGYDVNAKVGRQFGPGVWIVRHEAQQGTLARRVIVHLGTNGAIEPDDCDRLIAGAGPVRRVFLVTIKVPRSWEASNNDTLRACAGRYEKVHVIRWWSKSHDHPEWFAGDGYHPNPDGQRVFARYVDREVDEVLAALRSGAPR